MVIVLNILIAVVMGGGGLALGWFLRGRGKDASESGEDSSAKIDLAQDLMGRLQDITANVAADVDEHSVRMQAISDELSAGDNLGSKDVVNAVSHLIEANEKMQQQLKNAEKKLDDQQEELLNHAIEARTDALTRIYNRRVFDQELDRCRKAYVEQSQAAAVMILDVDHFKKFNDTHGHQAGDEVLRRVASCLRNAVTPEQAVCRYGGEEFAIIFPGMSAKQAEQMAEKARDAIDQMRIVFEGKELHVTASAGLAEFCGEETPADLVKRADQSLYHAKEEGRNKGFRHDGTENHLMQLPKPAKKVAKKAPEKTEKVAKDPITGLSVAQAFHDDLTRRVGQRNRDEGTLSIVQLRIDNYSGLVEKHGATVGKVLLRTSTQFLNAAMRDMDHVARLGDDRFGMLLPETNEADARKVADRLRTAIAKCKLPLGGAELRFSVSLGVTEFAKGDTVETILNRSEEAMQEAVANGGNCCYRHSGEQVEPAAGLAS